MIFGLASGHVSLARVHDAWTVAYERERSKIATALGEHIIGIEHVGSTAIPDVPAKPILDILVGVHDFDGARVCIAPMIDIGYSYCEENGIPMRHYFVKGDPRTHHVHMVEIESDDWKVTLGFRDLLRTHPDLASEYGREKERLVRDYFDDREAYQREKDKVVESILGASESREPDVPSPIDLRDPADARAWESMAQARPGRAEMFQRFLAELQRINRSNPDWAQGLSPFDAVVTNQAVHELRHKRYAKALHSQVARILKPRSPYLVCDHYCGEGGMQNEHLYMTIEEQREALLGTGFRSVDLVGRSGTLVMHRVA